MRSSISISHEFVDFIPDELADRVIYVSIPYATAAHRCFCGCGSKVVTPISRQGWSVTFDGETVSLHPSIGNYGLQCQSHYFVRNDRVVWARAMSQEEIDADRLSDDLLPLKRPGGTDTAARPASIAGRFLNWLRRGEI
ncbi:DUF6527 family protein [Bradyrhizobium sp. NAS96.2]|uniref:DUF6527 family protein n=1 Tax=Bradyrhizobium sp. NAS96.2 TaxID=1680160 RepID=UPI00093942F2|nr:DUF6527 family protein [Bradyrhizobium sp. NAS96.2]